MNRPELEKSAATARVLKTGVALVALYFGTLALLGSIGASAKAPFWLGLQITLLYLGPPLVAFLFLWACYVAVRYSGPFVLWSSAILCATIVALWIVLFQSFRLVLGEIRRWLVKSELGM